jgi:sugar/nucleoside kinase (ribokinase family)
VAQWPVEGVDTGVCVVMVDESGERTFVTGTGAEGQLGPAQLDAVNVRDDDLVYVSGYSLLHESNRAALLGWLPGIAMSGTLFDPGPLAGEVPSDVLAEALSEVDVLLRRDWPQCKRKLARIHHRCSVP